VRDRSSRKTVDSYVAKALKCEVWLVLLDTHALECVAHSLLRVAQIPRVKVSGFVQHLGVAKTNRRSGGSADFQTHPTDHVLTEIKNGLSSRRMDDANGLEFLHASDGRADGCDQIRVGAGHDFDATPRRIVITLRAPAGLLETSVVCLAVVDVRSQNRAGRGFPVFVGANDLLLTICVMHDYLGE
jgi:hypothetical protein